MTGFDLIVANTAQVAAEDFDGKTVLVNFTNGRYFNLQGAAPLIWKLLQKPVKTDILATHIATLYGIEEDKIRPSLDKFVDQLKTEGLLLSRSTTEAQSNKLPDLAVPDTFEPPVVEVFDDLEELFFMDPIHEVDEQRGWPHAEEEALQSDNHK